MQVFSAEVNRVFDPIKGELRIIFTAAKFDIIILNNNEVCGIYAYSVWYHWLQFYKVDFFCSHIVASWEYFERFGGICMYS